MVVVVVVVGFYITIIIIVVVLSLAFHFYPLNYSVNYSEPSLQGTRQEGKSAYKGKDFKSYI